MKKRIMALILVALSFTLISCKGSTESYYTSFSSMDTNIQIFIYDVLDKNDKDDKDIKQKHINNIKDVFDEYHILTNNFVGYEGVNNVFYINENPGKKINIDKKLYDILKYSEKLKEETNGYFDISIGKIVDEWKSLINYSRELEENDIFGEEYKEKIKAKITEIEARVDSYEVIENGIKLTEKNGKFYVQIEQGVKIDLGAIAKGYVVDIAGKYLKENNINQFKIHGSESSLYFGENPNRKNNVFKVGLRSDYMNVKDPYYGVLSIKNINLSTSGDLTQNVKFQGKTYHHIISPKTKRPETYYNTLTVLSENGAYADALTTALFSMNEEELKKWLEKNPVDVVLYTSDDRVITYLEDNKIFELLS